MKKITAIWLLDKLASAFLFLCVFAFEFPVMGVPLRYIIIVALFGLSLIICKRDFSNRRILFFGAIVFVSYSILAFQSIVVKGNDIGDYMFFVKPFLVFLAMPAYSHLFRKYGVDRYMRVFAYSMIGLILFFLYLIARTIINPGYGLGFNERSKLIMVAIYGFMPRIVFKNFVFLIPLAIYLLSKCKGWKKHLCFWGVFFIALLSQTFGIVLALLVVYFIFLYRCRAWGVLIPLCLIGGVSSAIIAGRVRDTFMETKADSTDYKSAQVMNITKNMEGLDYCFGRGLGCQFTNFDGRKISEPIIEVSGVQIFQSGGILFMWLIVYPYLLPVIPCLLSRRRFRKLQALSLSQFGIFAASFSNPYLWSGSVGLLFMMLFIAYQGALRTRIVSVI